ncbi:MAG: hypothetical protein ABDH21_02365 [bacterium]
MGKVVIKIVVSLIVGLASLFVIQAEKFEKVRLSPNFGNPLGRNIDNVDEKHDSALVLDNLAGGVVADMGAAIFVAPDNQVFVCGFSFNGEDADPVLLNINTDGKLNPNFGKNGIVVIRKLNHTNLNSAESLYVRDQKIYLIGQDYLAKGFVLRFNYKGRLDRFFGTNGIVKIKAQNDQHTIVAPRKIYVDQNHNAYIAGNFVEFKPVIEKNSVDSYVNPFVLKLDQNGDFDKTFGSDGFLFLQIPLKEATVTELLFDNHQNILLGGHGINSKSNHDIFIVKLSQDGNFDIAFADSGKVLFDYQGREDQYVSMCIDKNNNLYAAINTRQKHRDILVLKYTPEGYIDTSFGLNGMVIIDNILGEKTDKTVSSIKVDDKGRIYIAGARFISDSDSQLIVGRIDGKGGIDTSFGKNGFVVVDNIAGGKYADVASSIDLDRNLNIFVTGFSAGKPPKTKKENLDLIVLKIQNI